MTLKEFRLGNYFMNDKDSEQLDYWHFDCYKHEEIKPIPLTEEWVLRFGFKNDSMVNITFFLKGFGYITIPKNGNCIFRKEGIEVIIKYVHQLQNLYFALTGEELEIKNP